jgi:hypothetical protein
MSLSRQHRHQFSSLDNRRRQTEFGSTCHFGQNHTRFADETERSQQSLANLVFGVDQFADIDLTRISLHEHVELHVAFDGY